MEFWGRTLALALQMLVLFVQSPRRILLDRKFCNRSALPKVFH